MILGMFAHRGRPEVRARAQTDAMDGLRDQEDSGLVGPRRRSHETRVPTYSVSGSPHKTSNTL